MSTQPVLSNPNHTSTYPLDKLLSLWKSGTINIEQLAGHLLQHVILHEKRLLHLEKSSPNSSAQSLQIDMDHVLN